MDPAWSSPRGKPPPMSLESVLDEERIAVLEILEGRASQSSRAPALQQTPAVPIRSMLDVDDAPPTLHNPALQGPVRSMLDIDSSLSSPITTQPVRSMLDIDTPPSPSPSSASSALPTLESSGQSPSNSPPPLPSSSHDSELSASPASSFSSLTSPLSSSSGLSKSRTSPQLPSRPIFGRSSSYNNNNASSRPSQYQFGNILTPIHQQSLKKKNDGSFSSSSRPSQSRASFRNHLPQTSVSGGPSSLLAPPTEMAVLKDGRKVDLKTAYRKLSDANLARAGASLSDFALRRLSQGAESGNGRLAKSYIGPDGEELGSSSDEAVESDDSSESIRGRKMDSLPRPSRANYSPPPPLGTADIAGRTIAQGLLAAAEEERINVTRNNQPYQYRSLLDKPAITLTSSGQKLEPALNSESHSPSRSVHPVQSANNSDTEEQVIAIKRAQSMAFSMTPIMHTPGAPRTSRILVRGDYHGVTKAAQEEKRSLRRYLTATDLSDEAIYALEWAFGSIMRDGDTLLAVCCVDEEGGIAGSETLSEMTQPGNLATDGLNPPVPSSLAVASAASSVSLQSPMPSPRLGAEGGTNGSSASAFPAPSQIGNISGGSGSGNGSDDDNTVFGGNGNSDSNAMAATTAEGAEERAQIVEEVTARVLKILRRTRLQVRVIVEVVHCKTPRHLMTEMIDYLNPTLVILGSRGRSALKGVILGSFSNYLVTKSSIPVMVARKRPRKIDKYKRSPNARQVNVLSNPSVRSLSNAKVD